MDHRTNVKGTVKVYCIEARFLLKPNLKNKLEEAVKPIWRWNMEIADFLRRIGLSYAETYQPGPA